MNLQLYDGLAIVAVLLQVLGLGFIMIGLERIICIFIWIAVAPIIFDELFWLWVIPTQDMANARLASTIRMTNTIFCLLSGLNALFFLGPCYKPIAAIFLDAGGVIVLFSGLLHLFHAAFSPPRTINDNDNWNQMIPIQNGVM